MIDYKEEMTKIFCRYYAPFGEQADKKNMSTTEIDFLFRGVMPSLPTSEHDVYELMTELGFEQEKVIIYEKVIILEEDKKKGIQEEIDLVPVGQVFKWIVFEKD
ncbi:hypothetical protein [Chryseobacterium terrae]|uniref:Uncharacterized protein n=1 Tax=Chryseobacterium terrae TaxID=3163299 RepID=A0ABW8Y6K0_9FLAO